MFKKLSIIFALWAAASSVAAHSMSPGFQKKYTPLDTTVFHYKIQNDFDKTATFSMQVFDREWDPLPKDKWLADQNIKLVPGQTKRVRVKLKMDTNEQKVFVCSVLDGIGDNDEQTGISTRICSRLWRWR